MKHTARRDAAIIEILGDAYQGASPTKLRKLLKFANVTLDGVQIRKTETLVKAGQVIAVEKQEKPSGSVKAPFRIIWQDQHLLVAEKPVGLITAGEGITRRPTMHKLVDLYIKESGKGGHSAFPVHRLDKEVGGLVVFAKSALVQEKLKANWHSFTKCYLAVTEKAPAEVQGTISTWLAEHNLKMYVTNEAGKDTRQAVTHYKYLSKVGKYHLLEVELSTGRKNQIRVHLTHIGCPIVGDYKYGADATYKRQVRLMATQLRLLHPVTGSELSFKIEPSTIFLHPKDRNETYK